MKFIYYKDNEVKYFTLEQLKEYTDGWSFPYFLAEIDKSEVGMTYRYDGGLLVHVESFTDEIKVFGLFSNESTHRQKVVGLKLVTLKDIEREFSKEDWVFKDEDELKKNVSLINWASTCDITEIYNHYKYEQNSSEHTYANYYFVRLK